MTTSETEQTACGGGLNFAKRGGEALAYGRRRLRVNQPDMLEARVRDLEQENEVLAGALADAGAAVGDLEHQLEQLEALARPLTARLATAS